jgi:hypothetical protein
MVMLVVTLNPFTTSFSPSRPPSLSSIVFTSSYKLFAHHTQLLFYVHAHAFVSGGQRGAARAHAHAKGAPIPRLAHREYVDSRSPGRLHCCSPRARLATFTAVRLVQLVGSTPLQF